MDIHEQVFWHALSGEEAVNRLQSDATQGLSQATAKKRLLDFGGNFLDEAKKRSLTRMILDQFSDFMVLVLIASALIAGWLGEPEDTIAIAVIVMLNSVLGFIQEYRAEKAMEALKVLAITQTKVLRSGTHEVISSRDLVPGDIVFLEAGNIVPADIRIITAIKLKIEEAALTGESQPSEKVSEVLLKTESPVGDRLNMAHKGTLVTYGRGVGVVAATGMRTELGRIATLLQTEKDAKTPLQKRLTRFGKILALVVIALCGIIFLVGVLRGEKPLLMFMTALSLAVAAIPEALPAIVTVLLALGAKRMVKKNALIRRLSAVETLGSVTYICSDKTGTLTQNQMQVDTYALNHRVTRGGLPDSVSDKAERELILRAMALNSDVSVDAGGELQGDPTETALFRAAQNSGFIKSEIERQLPRIAEIPFSSERGRMSTIHNDSSGQIHVFTKGAPERVLPLCRHQSNNGNLIPLEQGLALSTANSMAKQGLRVLAFAHRRLQSLPSETKRESVETCLSLIGFVGLIDPPRPEAKQAINHCQSASIRVVMITGDHPATALAIARNLGIVNESDIIQGEHGPVITGQELERLSPEEFESRVERIRVYARVSPEQKIYVVKTLQKMGEFVAMTGDGVNDAPALKSANIGVAMGKMGTDVAREAAHMVLLDDNFATIVAAVREGRRIFDNIRKFIKYTLTSNAGEIWILFLAPFLGLPVPLLPIHILWVNLVTDGLPGLALAAEPEELGIMKRPPRRPNESIFAHGLWQHAVWVGLLMGALNLAVMAWAYHSGSAHWQSMVFTVLTLSQMGHVLAVRSERESIFKQGFLSNLPLLVAVLITFALQMATLYVPLLNSLFKTEALTASELFICLAISPAVFVAVEIEKCLIRRGRLYRADGFNGLNEPNELHGFNELSGLNELNGKKTILRN